VTPATAKSSLSGARKAAILLTMLGEDAAAVVFRNLGEDDLQRVADEVAHLGAISADVSLQVFEEYERMTQSQGYAAQGGRDLARRYLTKAFGEQSAVDRLKKMASVREEHPLESLRRADPQKLARFLESEHPQTVALILGLLGDRQASALLMSLPSGIRSEAVKRLAALQKFSPEMAERVSAVLSRQLKAVGEQGKRTYAGFQSVADMMNCVDSGVAQEILENIEREEPTLAIGIRDLMFTFGDLIQVDEMQIRELMAVVDKRVLATALKGTSEDLKNHFFRTMSSRAVEMLKEDVESLGPIRSKEVTKAQAEIVTLARKLEAEGKIVLKGEGSDEYVV